MDFFVGIEMGRISHNIPIFCHHVNVYRSTSIEWVEQCDRHCNFRWTLEISSRYERECGAETILQQICLRCVCGDHFVCLQFFGFARERDFSHGNDLRLWIKLHRTVRWMKLDLVVNSVGSLALGQVFFASLDLRSSWLLGNKRTFGFKNPKQFFFFFWNKLSTKVLANDVRCGNLSSISIDCNRCTKKSVSVRFQFILFTNPAFDASTHQHSKNRKVQYSINKLRRILFAQRAEIVHKQFLYK